MKRFLILILVILLFSCNNSNDQNLIDVYNYKNALFYVKIQYNHKNKKDVILPGSKAIGLYENGRNLSIEYVLKHINGSVLNFNNKQQYEFASFGEIEFDNEVEKCYKKHGIRGLLQKYCDQKGFIYGGFYLMKIMLINDIQLWQRKSDGQPYIKKDDLMNLKIKFKLTDNELEGRKPGDSGEE